MAKLAIAGGLPLRTKPFPVWPQYDSRESEALERVLKSGIWGTLGPEAARFTQTFCGYQQAKYGLAVTNGTVTLEILLRALGIGYEDEVIIPPYTFVATASSVIMTGAAPIFVDIEKGSYNMDPEKIEDAITARTKAIIPVHIGGRACDMDRIMEIASKHHLYVIEDAAHAHGSEWKGKRVGFIGHAGSFSFQASKNLNGGEGGFITTNDEEIYEKCWSMHHSGRSLKGTAGYDYPYVGTNARMTEWQAAVLTAQLSRLDEQIAKRMENAAYLNSWLKEIRWVEPLDEDLRITRNSYHLFIFTYIGQRCTGVSRDKFIKALNAEGIPCSSGYVPLYRQPLFHGEIMKRLTGSTIPYKDIYLENVETASYEEGIWLTQNLLLSAKEDIDDIANAIVKITEHIDEL